MKKIFSVLLVLTAIFLVTGCLTTDESTGTTKEVSSVKKPVIIDHKNQKWGTEPPAWAMMEREEIQSMPKYKDQVVFKFESEKNGDLQGAQLWMKNFTVVSEVARVISTDVEEIGVAASAGNEDVLGSYLENLVKSVTEAKISGLKKVSDYWVQRRFFDVKGKPEGDFYTVVELYTIPKDTLDKLIEEAISGQPKPKTPEEKRAQDLVNKKIKEEI